MAFNSIYAETTIYMMGEEFQATIEFRILSHGYKPSFYDPGAGPEFDIDSITLQWDTYDEVANKPMLGAEWVVDKGKLFDCLCNLDSVYDACIKQIEKEEEDDWREYDEDYYRDER